jgi:hypothetical protein
MALLLEIFVAVRIRVGWRYSRWEPSMALLPDFSFRLNLLVVAMLFPVVVPHRVLIHIESLPSF